VKITCKFVVLIAALLASFAHAETWTKGKAPILAPTLSWENGQVGEPSIYYNASLSQWEMYYVGGWSQAQVGRAVCVGDPTVPSCWVKNPTPVLGHNIGGSWMYTGHQDLLVDDAGYHIFFSNVAGTIVNQWLADSADGVNFTTRPIPIMQNTYSRSIGNAALFVDDDPDHTIYNMFDAAISPQTGGIFQVYLARAARIGGPWVEDLRGPITSLQVGTGTYGGLTIKKVNGKYNAWEIGAPSGQKPAYIYHFYSLNITSWVALNSGNPVIGITNENADVIGNPYAVDASVYGGQNSLLFYTTVLNSAGTGAIWVATSPGPLSSICPP